MSSEIVFFCLFVVFFRVLATNLGVLITSIVQTNLTNLLLSIEFLDQSIEMYLKSLLFGVCCAKECRVLEQCKQLLIYAWRINEQSWFMNTVYLDKMDSNAVAVSRYHILEIGSWNNRLEPFPRYLFFHVCLQLVNAWVIGQRVKDH